jgi:hypothetical protein
LAVRCCVTGIRVLICYRAQAVLPSTPTPEL